MATYNPYNAVKNISDLKGKYHTAKELDGDYMQYQTEAAKYYDELYKNGQQGVADELAAADYIKSLDILGRYKEDTTVDDFYSELVKVGTGDKSSISEQQSSYIDDLMGVVTGKTQIKPSQTASDLLDIVKSNDAIYNDRSGKVLDKGLAGMDSLLNYDYTKQSFYQPIMDTYKLYGDNAANGQLASGAAANAGNIDSYAAANAARQQLAFTNAGHQAALSATAQNQGSWLDAYKTSGDILGDLRLKNADMQSTFKDVYSTDVEERTKANDVLQQLFGDESEERKHATTAMIDKYLADLGLESTKYTTDSDERKNTSDNEMEVRKAEIERLQKEYDTLMGYNSDLAGYEADKYSADKTYDAAKYKADMEKTLKELGLQDTQETAESGTEAETETRKVREAGVQELYSVLSEFINALRGGQYEEIQSVDDIRREIKNWSGYSSAYDPIIQSYLNGFERKFGTTT